MIEIRPITLRDANAFVKNHHRHHKPSRGCVFCVSCVSSDQIVGVAIVGRPVARMLQDGMTCEVSRLCTDGTRNACSMLYGAARRAAKALGYRLIVTYTLDTEHGGSLVASGWSRYGAAGGGAWSRNGRERIDVPDLIGGKTRWEATL